MTSDVYDAKTRTNVMRAVKSKDTYPEIKTRSLLHSLGYRFRLHRKDLPGSPDIVLPGKNAVIFVNGCFWHGHNCKRGKRIPKTNVEYWTRKRTRNIARDEKTKAELMSLGWRVLTVWECEIKDIEKLAETLNDFLRMPSSKTDE